MAFNLSCTAAELNAAVAKANAAAPQSTTYTKNEVDTALSQKANTASLASVATSGSYNDLTNKPTIPATVTVDQTYNASSANAQSGAAVAQAFAAVFGNGTAIEPAGNNNWLTNYTTPGVYHVTGENASKFRDFDGYPSLVGNPFVMIVLQGAESGSVRHFYLFDIQASTSDMDNWIVTRFKPSGGSFSSYMHSLKCMYRRGEPT